MTGIIIIFFSPELGKVVLQERSGVTRRDFSSSRELKIRLMAGSF